MKVEQLGSLSVPQVEAESENLHKELTDLCSSMKVHQENLLAMLKDSASTIRGHKLGLETRIREEYPQLANIDVDTHFYIIL